jgi:hypothetical protein
MGRQPNSGAGPHTLTHTQSNTRELLHMFEMAQELQVLSPAEDWFRRALMKRILALSSWARSVARLRSGVTWLRDGDANTSLFHAQARFRKKKNFITSLTSTEGEILTSHDDKATTLFDFYDSLLGIAIQRDASINLDKMGLQSFDLGSLNVPFSNDEVWDTIKSIPSDKAPGTDGFTGRFYKSCWSIIKLDVIAAVSPSHVFGIAISEILGCSIQPSLPFCRRLRVQHL